MIPVGAPTNVTIICLLAMFSSVLDVLEIIREDGMNLEQRT